MHWTGGDAVRRHGVSRHVQLCLDTSELPRTQDVSRRHADAGIERHVLFTDSGGVDALEVGTGPGVARGGRGNEQVDRACTPRSRIAEDVQMDDGHDQVGAGGRRYGRTIESATWAGDVLLVEEVRR